MRKILIGLLLSSLALVWGCASVPMGDPKMDTQYKAFSASPDKATLYVYRSESLGGAIKMPILLDNKLLGDTGPKTYHYKQIDPGTHKLVSKTENDAELDLNAEAGKIYYVWQEVKMGMWAARSKLQLVDEKIGQAGVNQCKLAKTIE
jgi:Protein of unknown function (DUF2846)